jgi:peptidoglycan/xylan/chitin deacetylase (PgdA/CDA1 family)
MSFMNRNYVALAALALSTMVGCQEHGWSGKRAEDYKPLQYKGELEAADNTIRLERQRLSYLMPTAFRYTYGEEFRQLFKRAIEEIANEKLYRTQSDPSHYENTKQAFQAEFKRRMSDKGLK